MSKLYFIPGSQDLYGEECLKQVAADCRDMVGFLNEKLGDVVDIDAARRKAPGLFTAGKAEVHERERRAGANRQRIAS